MSPLDTFLSWLDEALIEAEHNLKLEQDGFRLLNSGVEEGGVAVYRAATCTDPRV